MIDIVNSYEEENEIEADLERITEKSVEGIVLVGIYDENGSLVKTSYNNLE